ncbi:MAG: hypothetical protein K6G11_10665, partial [Lachnospiraceae bacterium]|nr:hypothetical protein [Lachnospiraceae bacterium]
ADDKLNVVLEGSQTLAGTSANKVRRAVVTAVVNGETKDITDSYDISFTAGSLEVTKKTVVITATDKTRVYDGTALTSNKVSAGVNSGNTTDYTIGTADGDDVINTLAADDRIYNLEFSGARTTEGNANTTPTNVKIVTGDNDSLTDVTDSYEVIYEPGILTITKKALTITAGSDSKKYDGKALTCSDYEQSGLVESSYAKDTIKSVTFTGSQTVVGSSSNIPSNAVILDKTGRDVSDSYEVNYVKGTLTVSKRSIRIIAKTVSKQYDGTALTSNEYDIQGDKLADGDSIYKIKIRGSQTVNGSSDNEIVENSVEIINSNDELVTDSYTIELVKGTLTVGSGVAITITAGTASKAYDGKALTCEDYKISSGELKAGDTIKTVTFDKTVDEETNKQNSTITYAGSTINKIKSIVIVDAAGYDVTDNYTPAFVPGELTVTPKEITVTAGSNKKTYDGTALTDTTFKAKDTLGNEDEDFLAGYASYSADRAGVNSAALAADDKLNVVLEGSQTVVGSSANKVSRAVVTTEIDGVTTDITDSYAISYVNGSLKVNKKSVEITATYKTKEYDGTALTSNAVSDGKNEGVDTDYTVTGLSNGDSINTLQFNGSQTQVGRSTNKPCNVQIVDSENNDVTNSYEISYEEGILEVTKKALTITATDATKVYNGKELTSDAYTATELADNDSIYSVGFTGSQTTVGTSVNTPENAVIINNRGMDVSESYNITYEDGDLTVNKRTITIAANSASKKYDGSALTCDEYTILDDDISSTDEYGLAAGDRITAIEIVGSQTKNGKSANTITKGSVKISNAASVDVTQSYDIVLKEGELVVGDGVPLTITAGSAEKTYDGTALTCSDYEITAGALAAGDTIKSVTFNKDVNEDTSMQYSTITYAGHTENVIESVVIVNKAGEDVTDNYTPVYMPGLLTITPKVITITAGSDSKTFDGTALTCTTFNAADSEGNGETETLEGYGSMATSNKGVASKAIADADKLMVVLTGSQTTYGSSANKVGNVVITTVLNGQTTDITDSYKITTVNGELSVTKQKVTITANDKTKEYDGKALVSGSVEGGVNSGTSKDYTVDGLIGTDSIDTLYFTGSQTQVGKSLTTPRNVKIVNADNEDVTKSYDVVYEEGSLSVSKKSLTITASNESKVYDGNALTSERYTITSLADGDELKGVTFTGSQTVKGSSYNVPSNAVITNKNGENVADSYAIGYVRGELTVTKRKIIITANSAGKMYDGTPLTCDEYTVQTRTATTGLAEGDKISEIEIVGSQTEINGEDDKDNNIITPDSVKIISSLSEDVTDSYDIRLLPGTLTVGSGEPLTITAGSADKTYDGKALKSSDYEITSGELSKGHEIVDVTFDYSETAGKQNGTITYAGSTSNVITGVKIVDTNDNNKDVTGNYTISYESGVLTVDPKEVVITAGSDEKTYDGTALTCNTFKAADNEGNVDAYFLDGYLSYSDKNEGVSSKAIAENDKINVVLDGSQTTVGSSDNKVGKVVVTTEVQSGSAGGTEIKDVTDSYSFKYVDGSLTVDQKTVTITALDKSKTYDGTALTSNAVVDGVNQGTTDYEVSGLSDGDSIEELEFAGSRTSAGNAYTTPQNVKIVSGEGSDKTDVTDSYKVVYKPGILTVEKKKLTISAVSADKTYDGKALTSNEYTYDGLVSGTDVKDTINSVTFTGSQTVVGSSKNVPADAVIYDKSGNDVTGSYEITYEKADLTVEKRTVTIVANSASKTYDGQELTCDDYTILGALITGAGTGLADGDRVYEIEITGSQTKSGSSKNKITEGSVKLVNINNVDVTESYDIVLVDGTLTVGDGVPITITAGSAEKTYDGTPLTCDDYRITSGELMAGDTISEVTFDKSLNKETDKQNSTITYAGSTGNVIKSIVIVNASGEDVTNNYLPTFDTGLLNVTPKEITITAGSADKVYDGLALASHKFKVSDVYGNEDADFLDVVTAGVSSEGIIGTDRINVTIAGSQTDVGSSENKVSSVTITTTADATDSAKDVTDSYKITRINGTLSVSERTVTITATDKTKVYDGVALTSNKVVNGVSNGDTTDYTVSGLADGDSIDLLEFAGSQTVAGKSSTTPNNVTILTGDKDSTKNYNVVNVAGLLTVTVKDLTITATDAEKTYDGTALTSEAYTAKGLVQGDEIESVSFDGHQTTVGTSKNNPSAAVVINSKGRDVSKSYDITYNSSNLTVNKREIIIAAGSASKKYDGSALESKEFTILGSELSSSAETGLARGDKVTEIEITGSQLKIGSSANKITENSVVITNSSNVDVTSSYDIKLQDGTLTVGNGVELTLTAGSAEKAYDGTPLTCDTYEITSGELVVGDRISEVTFSDDYDELTGNNYSSITKAGTAQNVIESIKIVNENDEDVTADYTLSYIPGELVVTPIEATITAKDAEKIYDSKPLTSDEYDYSGLIDGDKIKSVEFSGSQTLIGVSENMPSNAKIENADGEDVTGSYRITYKSGLLRVTRFDLEITAASAKKTYDGTALTDSSWSITDGELCEGDEIQTVIVSGSRLQSGASKNIITRVVIVNSEGEDVTDSYDLSLVTGTLTVNKRNAVITAGSATKVYDATALRSKEYEVQNLADGDSVSNL